ncbi:MAG: DUF3592 domain-containing protein [Candidatus Promineifilaceae bacterium]|nr:DUF3592 domain-containing protein [Anaerolineaceae bacterium]
MRKNSDSMGCGATVLFTIVFFAVGIGLSIWGWSVLQNARVSESWPTTDGEILSSSVRVDRDEDGTSYFGDVTFRYLVDDFSYTSDNVSFGQYGGDRDHAEAIVARYPAGSGVTVHYDPADPETAVLEPGVTWSSYMLLAMGALFTCIPLIVLPLMLRSRFT